MLSREYLNVRKKNKIKINNMADIKDSVFTKLTSQQIDLINIGIQSRQIPKILYKYMTAEGAMRFLGNGKLLFNRPSDFNDPFECKAIIDNSDTTKEEWRQYLSKQALDPLAQQQLFNIIMSNPKDVDRIIGEEIQRQNEANGILCLSSEPDNILLWSHYAKDHKGVCLVFDISKDIESFTTPLKVDYDNHYPKYNYIRNPEMVLKVALKKAKMWNYEKEYRVLKTSGYGLRFINKDALVGIIFGVKINHNDNGYKEEDIRNLAFKNGYSKVKFSHCELDSSSYKLNIL